MGFKLDGVSSGRCQCKIPNESAEPRPNPFSLPLVDVWQMDQWVPDINKLKFVIFEGPDKSGKSTLFQAFRRRTKYQPLAIERFTGSNYVYDQFYERESNSDAYLQPEKAIQDVFDCYLVVLIPDDEVLEERIMANEIGKDKEIALENYVTVSRLFEDYYYIFTNFRNKMIINTGRLSVEEAVNQILHFIRWED
jgi:thymidylate kinase